MIPENTIPPPEMVGMITTIVVKVNPEREDSETRTVSILTEIVCITIPKIMMASECSRLFLFVLHVDLYF